MAKRAPAYVVTLQPAPGRDGIRDMRCLLKIAKRFLRLRAISARELPPINRRRGARRPIAAFTQRRNEDITMTILKRFGPGSKYLKLEDVHGKPPMRERIGLVKPEKGKFGERLVLTFEPSGKMLSLNKPSVGNLLRDFGEDDSDWVGKLVEVYAGEVETQNGTADAILVRAADLDATAAAKVAKPAKAKSAKSEMDDEIPF